MAKVVTFGELMLRIQPADYYRFVQVDSMTTTFGGGEANVAVSLANYGDDAYFVTKLPTHEIGQAAVNSLRKYGVHTEYIVRGGPRVGIYYNEKGASQRVQNVFTTVLVLLSSLLNLKNSTGIKSSKVLLGSILLVLLQLLVLTWFRLVSKAVK